MIAAALAFLVATAYAPGLLSGPTQPKWWVLWIGAPAFLLIRLLLGGAVNFYISVIREMESMPPLRQPAGLGMSLSHWLGLAFLVWCCASLGWATSFDDAVGEMINLVALALVFVIGTQEQDLRPVRLALGAAATVNAALMLYQTTQHHDPAGLFLGHVIAAEFGVVALVGLLSERGWSLALIPGAAVCALLPMSRGPLLALVIVVPFLFGPKQRFVVWMAVLGAIAVALSLDAYFIADRSISMAQRMDIWSWTYANLTWLGYGIGNYADYFGWEFAHSEPLNFAFEVGVGSVFLWAFFASVLWGSSDPVARAMLVAVMVESFVSFTLHHAATAFVAALCAGHLSRGRSVPDSQQLRGRTAHRASPQHGLIGVATGNL